MDIKDDNTDQTSNAKIVTASSSKLLAIKETTRREGEVAVRRHFGFENRSIDKASYMT